ncbi:MAG: hypothetical protein K0R39_2542, partial [Symbiobacteriaceae bacterium]|nr:hypothetical protein [Symbiobacteriaceae bacterium]
MAPCMRRCYNAANSDSEPHN